MRVAPSLYLADSRLLLIGCGADQMFSVESPPGETDASTADVRHIAATTEVESAPMIQRCGLMNVQSRRYRAAC